MKEKKCGYHYSTIIPDDVNLWYTVISENTDLSSNNITESKDLVLSSLHISGPRYRIYSSKSNTSTNDTINKMTESIKSNTILKVNHNKGVIRLLINIKCGLELVVEPGFPFRTTQNYTSLVFCETNV